MAMPITNPDIIGTQKLIRGNDVHLSNLRSELQRNSWGCSPEPEQCNGEQRGSPDSHFQALFWRDGVGSQLLRFSFIVGQRDQKVLGRDES